MEKKNRSIEEYIVAMSLLIMTIITFANVISRKLFKASWSFTEEITANLFILSSMLGAAIAAKRGCHLGLSLLTDKLSMRAQKIVSIIGTIISVVFCAVLIKEGFVIVKQEVATGQLTPALGWPEWIFGTFIPIGAIFILFRFIENGVNEVRNLEDQNMNISEGEGE